MTRFLFKITLFISPFVFLSVLDSIILPVDFFTFRVWEALYQIQKISDGCFYPGMHISKMERGDSFGFRDTKPKLVEWQTDPWGFRNKLRKNEPDRYDIVVVGDSNIIGSYLDQQDILSEVLRRKCNCNVYSYGGPQMARMQGQFFADERFRKNPPKVIIVESRPEMFCASNSFEFTSAYFPSQTNKILPVEWAIFFDRVRKFNMVQYLRSRLGTQRLAKQIATGELSHNDKIDHMVKAVMKMQNEAHRRGSDFIFFLMPTDDRSLDEAVVQLRQKGVKMVAYLPTTLEPHGVNLQLYFHENDSHWRAESVVAVADHILLLIE